MNMARQNRELHHRLGDAEKLRLYAQLVVSMHQALDRSKHWERGAKVGVGKSGCVEKERDEAKEEAHLARLDTVEAGDSKALVEDKLAKVHDALVVLEEVKRKAKVEAAAWWLSELHSC